MGFLGTPPPLPGQSRNSTAQMPAVAERPHDFQTFTGGGRVKMTMDLPAAVQERVDEATKDGRGDNDPASPTL